ncbi:MAG TPA: putative zinc-binding protein [Burkholderiales bacterium]
MTVVLRPMPVLFACQGCPEFGQTARDVGTILDQQRLAESHWIGAPACNYWQLTSTARSRFPVYALDGCAKHCTQHWLAGHGVRAQRHFTLGADGESASELAARIAERISADA